jgi:hypothetical protein
VYGYGRARTRVAERQGHGPRTLVIHGGTLAVCVAGIQAVLACGQPFHPDVGFVSRSVLTLDHQGDAREIIGNTQGFRIAERVPIQGEVAPDPIAEDV